MVYGGEGSCLLTCIMSNDLSAALRNKSTGCHIHIKYASSLGYADDMVMTAPTLDTVQKNKTKILSIKSH